MNYYKKIYKKYVMFNQEILLLNNSFKKCLNFVQENILKYNKIFNLWITLNNLIIKDNQLKIIISCNLVIHLNLILKKI